MTGFIQDKDGNLYHTSRLNPAPIEADKDWNECMDILRRGQYKSASETCHALLAWRDKAVLRAEIKARTDTNRIYSRAVIRNGAKDE